GTEAHPDLLAGKISRTRDAVRIGLAGERLDTGDGIGHGEVELLFALFRDGHLVDYHVPALGFQSGEDPVPLGWLERSIDPQLLCQGICEVHLEAAQLTAFILEVEGRVGALQANLDCAVGLDLIQEIGRKHGHEQARAEQQPKATEQEMATQDGESHVRSPDGSGSHKALTADIYSI